VLSATPKARFLIPGKQVCHLANRQALARTLNTNVNLGSAQVKCRRIAERDSGENKAEQHT
jgi:hypothetical protein